MIQLETLNLETIDYNNIEHLKFLRKIMESKDINYLWDLSNKELSNNKNKDKFLVLNEKEEKIGYINISDSTNAYYGNTVSIYYAIEESHRGNGYGKKLIKEIKKWLFKYQNIDCIIAQVDIDNTHSKNVLLNSGMEELNMSDDYVTYIERKNR